MPKPLSSNQCNQSYYVRTTTKNKAAKNCIVTLKKRATTTIKLAIIHDGPWRHLMEVLAALVAKSSTVVDATSKLTCDTRKM